MAALVGALMKHKNSFFTTVKAVFTLRKFLRPDFFIRSYSIVKATTDSRIAEFSRLFIGSFRKISQQ